MPEDQMEEDQERLEAFKRAYENAQTQTREKLLTPHDDLGLVLKCHLIAEDSLTNYLIVAKGLPNIRKARLTFNQKVQILDETDGLVFKNKGGLRQLNTIRNNFGHDFHTTLEIEDDSALTQGVKSYLKVAEVTYSDMIAEYERLGGEPESVEDLKLVIDGMLTQTPKEPKFLGDNFALLSQQEPREMVAFFVSSFCNMVAMEIHHMTKSIKTNA